MFLAPGLLAGCLGGDEASPTPDRAEVEIRTDLKTGSVLAFADDAVSLAPWLIDLGEVLRTPSEQELVQLEHLETPTGVIRLLTDGSAFMIVLDDDRVADVEDSILLARVFDVESNTTFARAAVTLSGGPVPTIPMPVVTGLRLDVRYMLEVHWFAVDGHEPIAAGIRPFSSDPQQVLLGTALPELGEPPFRLFATELLSWQAPVRFRAAAEIAFSGPDAGVDRPSEFERPLWGGTETGTYTITVNGSRVWQSLLFIDVGNSRVHFTRPEMDSVGGRTLEVWLQGYRPLEDWRGEPRTKAVEQAFTFELDVDYETAGGEVPEDEVQEFYVRHIPAYRWSGQGWQSDEVFRSLRVAVKAEMTP